MTLEELALKTVAAAESAGVDFMLVGSLAGVAYGVSSASPRVNLLVAEKVAGGLGMMTKALDPFVQFEPQVPSAPLTVGRRHVGTSRSTPAYMIELFELFDDGFVQEEFRRRRQVFVPMLGRSTWLPTAEDVIVQKLRWGRNKDLDDARDVLAVQGPESLDMGYIRDWCAQHGTTEHLEAALAGIPPL